MRKTAVDGKLIARQGDVLIKQVNRLPVGVESVSPTERRIVLAFGEVTGHAHAIDLTEHEVEEFAYADEEVGIVRRFLKVCGETAVCRHEEHAPIVLPPGLYEIIQQREYHPMEIRNVRD